MKSWWLLVLVGCAYRQATPSLQATPGYVLLGDDFEITGAWSSSNCHRSWSSGTPGDGWVALFAMEPKHPGTSGHFNVECNMLTTHVDVECSAPCDVRAEGANRVFIEPKQLGSLDVRATVTRDDTGEKHDDVYHYDVALPDEVQLACGATSPCGPDGVAAAHPLVRAYVKTAAQHDGVGGLRVNGHAPAANGEISLADLYPDARAEGGGVEPGKYRVVVSYLSVSSTFQVVAR